jgi:hypothetical protein
LEAQFNDRADLAFGGSVAFGLCGDPSGHRRPPVGRDGFGVRSPRQRLRWPEAVSSCQPNDGGISLTVRANNLDVEVRSIQPRGGRETLDPVEGSFASWLVHEMHDGRLSHEGTARMLGVSVKTVSRWARSETEPRMRDLRRLHDTFGELPALELLRSPSR